MVSKAIDFHHRVPARPQPCYNLSYETTRTAFEVSGAREKMADRSEAQHLADRIRTFRSELSDPEIGGILQLTSEQRGRFDAWADEQLAFLGREFDVDVTTSQGNLSWGMRIASALGGLALSAALVLFFHRYWGYFDTWLQIVFVLLAPLLLLAGAEYAAKRERTGYFSSLLAMTSLAAFILNLSVIGQVFNIVPTERALLAWGVFALAIAYRYRQRALVVIGLLLTLAYGCAALTASLGYHWFDFGSRPEHAAAFALLMWSLPELRRPWAFESIYRATGAIACLLSIYYLAEGEPVSYLPVATKTVKGFYETLGTLASAGLIWLGIKRHWSVQVNIGAVFFCLFLFSRFYHWWWDLMPAWLFFAIIGSLGVLAVIALKHLRRLA